MTRLPTLPRRQRTLVEVHLERRRRETVDLAAMVALLLVLAVAMVAMWRATDDRTEAAMAVELEAP